MSNIPIHPKFIETHAHTHTYTHTHTMMSRTWRCHEKRSIQCNLIFPDMNARSWLTGCRTSSFKPSCINPDDQEPRHCLLTRFRSRSSLRLWRQSTRSCRATWPRSLSRGCSARSRTCRRSTWRRGCRTSTPSRPSSPTRRTATTRTSP